MFVQNPFGDGSSRNHNEPRSKPSCSISGRGNKVLAQAKPWRA